MNKHLVISLLIFSFVIVTTVGVVLVAKGYRFAFNTGKIEIAGTGLLVVKSTPDGAQVFINDRLTTATNNTINLTPKEYSVRITKEGYFPWQKTVSIQAEAVSQAQALLLPTAPKLESVSDYGAKVPVIGPSLSKIAYTVASQSAKRNGVYVLDTSARPILTLQNDSTQIADDTISLFSEAMLTWSPDGKEILASISAQTTSNVAAVGPPSREAGSPTIYLLEADQFNEAPSDVTATLPTVLANWQKQKDKIERAKLNSLSGKLAKIVSQNFNVMSYSPDQTKILYEASTSADLPIIRTPRLIGVNSTPEEREIREGEVYIYDTREDRNYPLSNEDFEGAHNWLPDSSHLAFVKDKKIQIMEYDGLNKTVFYAGPFDPNYVFPWSDGTRIVILTDLGNSPSASNLYTISLK